MSSDISQYTHSDLYEYRPYDQMYPQPSIPTAKDASMNPELSQIDGFLTKAFKPDPKRTCYIGIKHTWSSRISRANLKSLTWDYVRRQRAVLWDVILQVSSISSLVCALQLHTMMMGQSRC
eukprot:GHVH01013656.1.p1 GENE.GHVH01013656.1~~GHVH01013656.1.p1  ORF type:complete len:121 (+),score=8.34 GHVH01013656.1:91-453(+)